MSDNDSESTAKGGEGACTLTARAIAEIVEGELHGDADAVIDSVAPLSSAAANNLSFLADRRYASALAGSAAGIVLVSPALAASAGSVPARIVVGNPSASLLLILPLLYPREQRIPTIHPTAVIAEDARIGDGVSLDEYAVIGAGAAVADGAWIGAHSVVGPGVTVGRDSRLFPHVTLYTGATVGDRVILHSGVRIASDGFGYVSTRTEHKRIPHVGGCIIEDDVEIGANTTVDRGSIDDTVIGAGTKIDNLVQIGHNVKVGKLCLIMAQVGIAGSTQIGDGCVLAGQAGFGGHITIGAGARIGGQSGVFGDVPAGESWSGYPARPHRESLRATAALFRLGELMTRLEKLVGERVGR